MKKKGIYRFILFIVLILPMTLIGCNNDKNSNPSVSSDAKSITQDSNKEIEANIINFIRSKDPNSDIKNFKIVYKRSVDEGNFIMTLYDNSNNTYEGLFFVESTENKVMNGDFTKVDKSVPLTHHESSGNLRKANEEKKNSFSFVGGVINDSKIDMVNIYFNDNSLASIQIDKTLNIYSYAKTDKFISIKSIQGVDTDGNIVFAYNY